MGEYLTSEEVQVLRGLIRVQEKQVAALTTALEAIEAGLNGLHVTVRMERELLMHMQSLARLALKTYGGKKSESEAI